MKINFEGRGEYLHAMRPYIRKVLKDAFPEQSSEEREEVVMETISRALTYWHTQTYLGVSCKASAGWLARIAKNTMLTKLDRGRKRRVAERWAEEVCQNSDSPEIIASVDQVLYGNFYTDLQKDIRDSHLLGRESLKEIADRRGLSYTYVKLECSRLRAQMKKNLGVDDA